MSSFPPHPLIRLHHAETFRALYSLPFPFSVAPLADPDSLASFRNERDFCKASGTQASSSEINWQSNDMDSCLDEPLRLALEFERYGHHVPLKRWDLDAQGPKVMAKASFTENLHVDGMHIPKMRVFFATNESPTRVVSHERTLNIFNRYVPELLDMRLDDAPAFLPVIANAIPALENIFRHAAQCIPKNTLCCMTGATLHFRPYHIVEDRVFWRGRTFEVAS